MDPRADLSHRLDRIGIRDQSLDRLLELLPPTVFEDFELRLTRDPDNGWWFASFAKGEAIGPMTPGKTMWNAVASLLLMLKVNWPQN